MDSINFKQWGTESEIIELYKNNEYDKLVNFPSYNSGSNADLVNKIKDGNSFLRFGDGEISILQNKGIYFQKANNKLQKKLLNLYENAENISKKYKCIFGFFIGTPCERTNYKNKRVLHELIYIYNIFYRTQQLDNNNKLKFTNYDALFFRYIHLDIHSSYRQIFCDYLYSKKYVIVTGFDSIINNIDKEINFIKNASSIITCKPINVFDDYDNLLTECLSYDNNFIFCLSLGPCAKVLGIELIKKNYQVLDIGRGIQKIRQ